jgi:hypothetical protein
MMLGWSKLGREIQASPMQIELGRLKAAIANAVMYIVYDAWFSDLGGESNAHHHHATERAGASNQTQHSNANLALNENLLWINCTPFSFDAFSSPKVAGLEG